MSEGTARMTRRSAGLGARDRGSVAVEFALLLPILLLRVFGIIDFGRALNAQITLTQAAREGARIDALNGPNLVSRTQAAATGLSSVGVNVVHQCVAGDAVKGLDAQVQTTYSFSFVTPVGAIAGLLGKGFGSPITLSAEGDMPCEI
jgi:Flp pilus assembly protein TadG